MHQRFSSLEEKEEEGEIAEGKSDSKGSVRHFRNKVTP